MRKIEQKILLKISEGRSFELGNTKFELCESSYYATLFLHNNPIIRYKYIEGEFIPTHISTSGWPTNVTKSRLNSLVRNIRVYTRRNRTYVSRNVNFNTTLRVDELVGDSWVEIQDNHQLNLI